MKNLQNEISATLIMNNRCEFFYKYFGMNYMVKVESFIYQYMATLSADYDGGWWNFYELSNGGFYISPEIEEDATMRINVSTNYFSNAVSSDAAGIIATLFALGDLAGRLYNENTSASENMSTLYHLLRDYSLQHDEADLILAAID
ncbi:TPA: antirestriction protein [Proteus mirabilis]|uniref:antirestriction protein n=1 Tax=Proteus mirabilis TaxID=584 RepID=UPI00217D8EC8|nr:antirestriction protein [Proteus mirabilis]MCS6748145.1 antirestriction protein [Proteus mirabilis]HEK2843855.1 antirestriction protein [Proteus mirabilis]